MTCTSLTCQDKNSSGLNTPPATVQQNQMRECHRPAREAGKGPQTLRAGPAGHPGVIPLGRSLWEPNRLEELRSTRPSPQRSALRAELGRGGWWNRGPVLRGTGAGTGVSGGGEPPCQRAQPPRRRGRIQQAVTFVSVERPESPLPQAAPSSRRLCSCLLQSKREVKGPGRAWEHPRLVGGGGPREGERSRLRGQHHPSLCSEKGLTHGEAPVTCHEESAENRAPSRTRAQHIRVTAVLGEPPGVAFWVSLKSLSLHLVTPGWAISNETKSARSSLPTCLERGADSLAGRNDLSSFTPRTGWKGRLGRLGLGANIHSRRLGHRSRCSCAGPSSPRSCSRASTQSPPPCRPFSSESGRAPAVWSQAEEAQTPPSHRGPNRALSCHFTEAQVREMEPSTGFPWGHPPRQLTVLLTGPVAAPSPARGSVGARSEEGRAEGRPLPVPTPRCTVGRGIPARPGESRSPVGTAALTLRPAQQRPGR